MMDENFDPNRINHRSGLYKGFDADQASRQQSAAAVADGNASLVSALLDLADGQVAVVNDLVAIRAGPSTYHPIKALKVNAVCDIVDA